MRAFARFLLIGLAFVAGMPAALAQRDPPARVGRVSIVEGALAFYGPGESDWSQAKVNFPVAENGWFATDANSRAEFRIGAETISFDSNTEGGFTLLRRTTMQLALQQGRVDLHLRRLRRGEDAEVDIAAGGVWLLQPGLYEIEAGGPDRPSRISVFEGSARFAGGGLDMTVKAGDALVLNGTDRLAATVEPVASDDFTGWCRSHDYREDRLAAPYHVSPAMTGFEELDAHGEWERVPEYGEVWYPRAVAANWAPYREGRWVWMERWGWTWVDDEPWGFAPFHYGRWARIHERWAWVPGRFVPEPVYAPALVAFVAPPEADFPVADAGPAVGWFPLAPGEVYWPDYTRDPTYIREVNVTNVNVTVINNVTRYAATQRTGTPPQVLRQNFANVAAATVVPAAVVTGAAQVAPAAVRVPTQAIQRAAVTVQPPPVMAPPLAAAAAGAVRGPAAAGPTGRPGRPIAAAPSAGTAPVPPHAGPPSARPNFSQLAPAPQLARGRTQPAQATTSATALGAQPPAGAQPARPGEATAVVPPPVGHGERPGEARPGQVTATPPAPHPPGTPEPHPGQAAGALPASHPPGTPEPHPGQASGTPPAPHPPGAPEPHPGQAAGAPPAPGRPPSAPDFSHLAPAHRSGTQPAQPAQAIREAAPGPAAPAAPAGPEHREAVEHPNAPAHQGPAQPGAQPAQVEPNPAPGHPAPPRFAAPTLPHPDANAERRAQEEPITRQREEAITRQRSASEAAARQQAEQRAAAEAAARQQAQQRANSENAARQRAASEAATRLQAEQRAAADAAARQQAQQRAAAQAAAQQQAQQRAALEAQHRAAAEAQQRAAAQAAAQQQAQQRAAAEAAARQQAAAQAAAQQRAAQAAVQQQQAQQRAAAEAAARQQAAAQAAAQQRAAQAAAQQQAQQRAAAEAAARAQAQQAQQRAAQQHPAPQPHCGHPNEPACPK